MKKFKDIFTNARRLNAFALKHQKRFVIALIILSLGAAVIPFLSSGVNALLINDLIAYAGKGAFTPQLFFLGILSAILFFIPDVVGALQQFFNKMIWISINNKIQLSYIKKKGEIDVQTLEKPDFQDLMNKTNDHGVFPVSNFLENEFAIIGNVVSVALGLAVLLFYDWRICIITILAILPQFWIEIKYNNDTWTIWDLDTKIRRRYTNLLSHFDEKNWLIELKLFQNIRGFYDKIYTILTNFADKQIGVEKKKLLLETAAALLSGGVIGAITFWILTKVIYGTTEVGTMIFVIAAIGRLQGSLISFLSQISRLHEQSLYTTDIFKILDTEPILYRSKNPITITGVTPEIKFENVSFAYPQSSSTTIENISLTIPAGEKFALVGENGAGKTTFVKLLCRIYDPTEGRILINGVNLREIDLESWYRTLGILFQEYAPYKFEVKDVIALGRSDQPFDIERVRSAAKASESESFISKWPQKFDQMLGTEFEKGIDPSKGQQQRLAIARLLHRKAGILILDEPTAAIDAEAEKSIFDQIREEAKDQTVILISHKFSTVRSAAERICVFKDKSIHELGTHDELMAKDGTYAKLFKEQAKGYEM